MDEVLTMSVLDELESESIFILREVVSEFERPVMMYSIGKDSSVLLHLARKAFSPAPIPFPLLHIDTSYKFPEMYQFRDTIKNEFYYAAKKGDVRVEFISKESSDGAQLYSLGGVAAILRRPSK